MLVLAVEFVGLIVRWLSVASVGCLDLRFGFWISGDCLVLVFGWLWVLMFLGCMVYVYLGCLLIMPCGL